MIIIKLFQLFDDPLSNFTTTKASVTLIHANAVPTTSGPLLVGLQGSHKKKTCGIPLLSS